MGASASASLFTTWEATDGQLIGAVIWWIYIFIYLHWYCLVLMESFTVIQGDHYGRVHGLILQTFEGSSSDIPQFLSDSICLRKCFFDQKIGFACSRYF